MTKHAFTFTFMHLTDAFIQSAVLFYQYEEPMTSRSTGWAKGYYIVMRYVNTCFKCIYYDNYIKWF